MELHQMYITPSNFAKIIGKGKQHPFNKTALEYADEIIMQSLGVEKEQLKVWALQHGIEYEPYAIQKFECKNFETVLTPERSIHHALIPYIKGRPDGIVNDEHIIEVKCPYNPTNHLKNLTDFSFDPISEATNDYIAEYWWQMQGYMWITGAKKCTFISFDPRYPEPLNYTEQVVLRNEEDIEFLAERCKEFYHYLVERQSHILILFGCKYSEDIDA